MLFSFQRGPEVGLFTGSLDRFAGSDKDKSLSADGDGSPDYSKAF